MLSGRARPWRRFGGIGQSGLYAVCFGVLREHEHVSAGDWDVRKDGMRGKGKKRVWEADGRWDSSFPFRYSTCVSDDVWEGSQQLSALAGGTSTY